MENDKLINVIQDNLKLLKEINDLKFQRTRLINHIIDLHMYQIKKGFTSIDYYEELASLGITQEQITKRLIFHTGRRSIEEDSHE